jgi:hypothetical protein
VTHRLPIVLAVLALASALPSHASESAGHECARVLDGTERLACYDAAFPPVRDEAALAAAAELRREQARRDFGLDGVQIRERSPEAEREVLPDRIEGRVTKLTYRDSGQRVVTLDNGQVWLLTEATSKGPIKVGDQVAVRKAALGSFVLVSQGGATLRARRVL